MNENMKKFEELMKNEEKASALFGDSIEETRKNLSAEGIVFSEDELTSILRGIADCSSEANSELKETDLDDVSGGSYNSDCRNVGRYIGRAFSWAVRKAFQYFG